MSATSNPGQDGRRGHTAWLVLCRLLGRASFHMIFYVELLALLIRVRKADSLQSQCKAAHH